ncbi:proline-rich receptor-like protein kinase PERK2 [Glycine max]|uniref:proline-rich receptor-like protein kinase PERK2 n=1 Tax=Glycine max TaxID=3847 RepID=UPI0007191666|nr:proline-rich receptor-like protein kinase PERK2 [Glycine max]|eukprot:XP_014632925.1 proline-rich receptor-like protein kinase PERK2 [Glycine max]
MADVEPSPAGVDRLEAAIAKLVAAQLRLESTLEALLLKLPLRTNHHYPSSFSVQSPPSTLPSKLTVPPCPVPMQHNQSPLPTPLPTPTLSPMPTPSPMPPSMPTSPPPPALIQSHPTPLPTPLPIVLVPLLANNNPHASSDRR